MRPGLGIFLKVRYAQEILVTVGLVHTVDSLAMIINISASAVYVLKVVGRLGLKLRAVLLLQFLTKHEPMAVDGSDAEFAHAPRLVGKLLRELCARRLIFGKQGGGV